MSTTAINFETALDAARVASCSPDLEIEAVRSLDDSALLTAQAALAEIRPAVDACSSLVAGEIGHRSRRDLGYAGLAQREGFRTAEALVQHDTGSTARDAATLVSIGKLVRDSLQPPPAVGDAVGQVDGAREPRLKAVGTAVSGGTLSVAAAAAIRSGLGEPTPETAGNGVSADDLAVAAGILLDESSELNADRMFKAGSRAPR